MTIPLLVLYALTERGILIVYFALIAVVFHLCFDEYRKGKRRVSQVTEGRQKTSLRLSLSQSLLRLSLSLMLYSSSFALFTDNASNGPVRKQVFVSFQVELVPEETSYMASVRS